MHAGNMQMFMNARWGTKQTENAIKTRQLRLNNDASTHFCPSRSSVGRASDSQPAPGSSPGSRRFGARYIEPPDGDGLRSRQRPQPVEVSERGGRVRLCGHVKLSLLNSADYQEYPDRKVGARACATSSAYCGLCPRQSFHSKGSD